MKDLPKFTLVHSARPRQPVVARLANKSASKTRVQQIGVWDLGAWVGGLPHVIEALNGSQPRFTFFEVQAALPAGLRSSEEKLRAFAKEELRRKLTRSEKENSQSAILDDDFLPRAEIVRRDLGIDYLVAISPAPLAGIFKPKGEPRTIYFDFFLTSSGQTAVVSVDGLRKLAARAQRPYEMAVGYVVLGAALVGLAGGDELDFHDEDRGCLFDFNEDRRSIVPALRSPSIEESCVRKMRPRYRSAALAMIRSLDEYRPPDRSD